MKKNLKKPVRDPLALRILTHLKKTKVRCGFGDQMAAVRRSR